MHTSSRATSLRSAWLSRDSSAAALKATAATARSAAHASHATQRYQHRTSLIGCLCEGDAQLTNLALLPAPDASTPFGPARAAPATPGPSGAPRSREEYCHRRLLLLSRTAPHAYSAAGANGRLAITLPESPNASTHPCTRSCARTANARLARLPPPPRARVTAHLEHAQSRVLPTRRSLDAEHDVLDVPRHVEEVAARSRPETARAHTRAQTATIVRQLGVASAVHARTRNRAQSAAALEAAAHRATGAFGSICPAHFRS